jgi:hypothetical protein
MEREQLRRRSCDAGTENPCSLRLLLLHLPFFSPD